MSCTAKCPFVCSSARFLDGVPAACITDCCDTCVQSRFPQSPAHSTKEGERPLTRGAWVVARRLELAAVARSPYCCGLGLVDVCSNAAGFRLFSRNSIECTRPTFSTPVHGRCPQTHHLLKRASVCTNAWDLFCRKASRAGCGRCAAVVLVALRLCGLNAAGLYKFSRICIKN